MSDIKKPHRRVMNNVGTEAPSTETVLKFKRDHVTKLKSEAVAQGNTEEANRLKKILNDDEALLTYKVKYV